MQIDVKKAAQPKPHLAAFYIPLDIKNRFKAKCAHAGKPMSEVVVTLIAAYLKGSTHE